MEEDLTYQTACVIYPWKLKHLFATPSCKWTWMMASWRPPLYQGKARLCGPQSHSEWQISSHLCRSLDLLAEIVHRSMSYQIIIAPHYPQRILRIYLHRKMRVGFLSPLNEHGQVAFPNDTYHTSQSLHWSRSTLHPTQAQFCLFQSQISRILWPSFFFLCPRWHIFSCRGLPHIFHNLDFYKDITWRWLPTIIISILIKRLGTIK